MPTYKNSTATMIEAQGARFEPGETKAVSQWIVTLPTGLTKTSDSPYLNPVVSSAALTTTTTVTVPNTLLGNYKIRVYVSTGSAQVQLNTLGTTRVIGAGDSYEIVCFERTVKEVLIEISSGTAYVTIEKI